MKLHNMDQLLILNSLKIIIIDTYRGVRYQNSFGGLYVKPSSTICSKKKNASKIQFSEPRWLGNLKLLQASKYF